MDPDGFKAWLLFVGKAYAFMVIAFLAIVAVAFLASYARSHAAVSQPRPEQETREQPITVYERPIGCKDKERPKRFMKMEVKRLINDRLVVAYIAISPVC